MARVVLKDLVKAYGNQAAVKGINLEIEDKSFVALVGPSGCGKSTTLRMIAGLESISHGEILIADKVVNGVPSRRRGVAMVFQSYALYPHMTVRGNLGFGLRISGIPKSEIETRVARAAEVLQLQPYLDRKPASLSGGQRQRVAMGRALVREPDVFLFDEPLSNLDAKLRTEMRFEIKQLHRRLQNTIVYVTHDQVEAMTMADVIVIMRDGRIEQAGTPIEVFNEPANTFVAGFIGAPQMNFLNGTAISAQEVEVPGIGRFAVGPIFDIEAGQDLILGFRPEALNPMEESRERGRVQTLRCTLTQSEMLGNETLLFCESPAGPVIARMYEPRRLSEGASLEIGIDLSRAHVFDRRSGASLRSGANGAGNAIAQEENP